MKVHLGMVGPGRIVRSVMNDLSKAEHVKIATIASQTQSTTGMEL